MGDTNAAQAVRLISALRDQLQAMAVQLTEVESQPRAAVHSKDRRSVATKLQLQAAELHRDMDEAEALIERLKRCYLDNVEQATTQNGTVQKTNPVGPMATSQYVKSSLHPIAGSSRW